jgi:class 3 adenylate cyclase/ABC-type branched-subunit amino acid transport system substrate-binding protein
MSGEELAGLGDPSTTHVPSLTRAFLFADLRDYTRLVETHGAVRAADLLERYRSLVREAVARFRGAEVKTEGDSFYVVFDSVSAAVECALHVQVAATDASAAVPDPPIRVGIGIHAGETVVVGDGYVGDAVNLAARMCGQARAGEILVSDTVRTLTRSVVPVTFESRGRHRLKGVDEPVAIFSVVPVVAAEDAWATGVRAARARRTKRRRTLAAIAGVGLLGVVAVAVAYALRPPPGLPPGDWGIAITTPLPFDDFRAFTRDSVRLAVDDANQAGGIGGTPVRLIDFEDPVLPEDLTPGEEFEAIKATSTAAAEEIAADPRVVAVIGPHWSFPAFWQIPVTNAAGLLQCGTNTSDPSLTRPDVGALKLRGGDPDRLSFIRAFPTNAMEGPAMASYAFNELGLRHVLVVDAPTTGDEVLQHSQAVGFAKAFETLGGRTTQRTLNTGADPAAVLDVLGGASDGPQALYLATLDWPTAGALRKAMVDAGHGSLPLLSWESIISPATPGTYLDIAGDSAAGTYATTVTVAPPKASFADRLRSRTDTPADALPYAAAAYACTEIVLQALRDVASAGVSAEGLREATRSTAVDPNRRVDTVIGGVQFDEYGDPLQQFVEVQKVDPAAAAGKLDWVIAKPSQDYGPVR